jgi:hypothetical protein
MKIDIGQLEFINPLLRSIVKDVEHRFGFEFTVTSLYRIGDKGVHGQLPLRGIDLRCRDIKVGRVVEHYINSTYEYDPARLNKKICMLHGDGANLHLHVQVHPESIVVNQ